MSCTLIPEELLQKSGKVLFITHLAIGDYAYLQSFFQALAKARPHLELHVWVDELRRTRNPKKWDGLKKYSLYDWLAECPFFTKVYNQTYSPELYKQSIQEACAENYTVVVSLATLRAHRYAKLARKICPDRFVAGIKRPLKLTTFLHHFAYKKLDAWIPPRLPRGSKLTHVTEVHAYWFARLFGLGVPQHERYPFINMPEKWKTYSGKYLCDTGIAPGDKIVFINITAKTKKRCWPIGHAIKLMQSMRQDARWRDAWFLLNAVPSDVEQTERILKESGLDRAHTFSATDNFFQLPSVLAACDLIISVETAVMHLANAVHVPVLALMRKKNPEWAPIDAANTVVITSSKRNDWIDEIGVARVLKGLSQM